MSKRAKIAWTDAVWNPTIGCSRVSAGCESCYAERFAHRGLRPEHKGLTVAGPKGPRWTGEVRCLPERLDVPLRWRKPRRVFVDSMSDLFHESVPDEFIDRVFAVMALCLQHTFQVLTKRPERMRDYVTSEKRADSAGDAIMQVVDRWDHQPPIRLHDGRMEDGEMTGDGLTLDWPLPNVWLGVSCEDQAAADERTPKLLRTPAAVRFLSLEPLLGPIHLAQQNPDGSWPPSSPQPETAWIPHKDWPDDFDYWQAKAHGIHWVIVGGESGPGARMTDVDSIRSVVEQCRDAGVPVFVKQLGSKSGRWKDIRHRSGEPGWFSLDLRDRKGADPVEWPEDLRVRELPAGSARDLLEAGGGA